MKETTFLQRATDPSLYDRIGKSWIEKEARLDPNSTRYKFFEAFWKNSSKWEGSRVLDLGCGTGWLSFEILKSGAREVVGIDPSYKNINFGKMNYLGVDFRRVPFDEFKEEKFDLIVSNMVVEHICDLNSFFEKASLLLESKGEIHLTFGNFDYMKMPRKNYELNIEKMDKDSYVVETNRVEGKLVDIIRKPKVILGTALKAGLKFNKIEAVRDFDRNVVSFFMKFIKV